MKKTVMLGAALCFALAALAQSPKDTTKVLCLGNSFTYKHEAHEKLSEIAASQGHFLDLKAYYVGGYTFNRHLNDIQSIKAIELFNPSTEYAFVFLQDQSQTQALYGQDPKRYKYLKRDAKQLVGRVRMYSPGARIFVETTWSYPAFDCGGFGSLEEFDRLLIKGSRATAKACKCGTSPIGQAFTAVKDSGYDVNLLDKDAKHQSAYGAYLKACVNYLVIFGEKFDASASCCGLDPEVCAYLRAVAENIVLEAKE